MLSLLRSRLHRGTNLSDGTFFGQAKKKAVTRDGIFKFVTVFFPRGTALIFTAVAGDGISEMLSSTLQFFLILEG